MTLTQLNQEVRQRLPRKSKICDRTVAISLEGMLFRIKLARLVPADGNRPDVIQKRLDYTNSTLTIVRMSRYADMLLKFNSPTLGNYMYNSWNRERNYLHSSAFRFRITTQM